MSTTKNDDDEIVLICGRTSEISPRTTGIAAICTRCQHEVWLSDTSISAVKKNYPELDLIKTPPTVVCIECGLKDLDKKDAKISPLTSEQRQEIIDKIFPND
jgi:DNA-directed RNA polymerase subunit RPC12/RpoP